MFRLLVVVSLIGCGICVDESFDDLPVLGVVGGTPTSIDKYPHQISLEYNGRHHCGGSIINPTTIVTAAHCVDSLNPAAMLVRAGTSRNQEGGYVARVKTYARHPAYHPGTINYDVAILFLAQYLQYTNTVKPITLAPANAPIPANQIASVSGWGLTSENGVGAKTLQHLQLPFWDHANCARAYPGKITTVMMCAGYPSGMRSTCQGDSGGPLIYRNQLYGIVSWGIGCARPNLPGVYASVPALRQWFDQTIARGQ